MTLEVAIPDIVRIDNALHVTRRSLLGFVDFRRFLLGQFLSQMADAMTTVIVASVLLLDSAGASARSQLLNMAVTAAVPLILAGPIAGIVTDRVSRRRILVGGQIVRIVNTLIACVAITFGPPALLFGVFGIQLCSNRVIYNVRAASLRHLVRQHELVAADSLVFIVGPIAATIGGAVALTSLTTTAVFVVVVMVIAHLVSLLAFSGIATVLGGGREHQIATWGATRTHLLQAKYRYTLIATSLYRLIFGVAYASAALVLGVGLGSSNTAYAMVLTASGVGGFVGSLVAEWANEVAPRKSLSVMSFAGAAVANLLAFALASPVSIGLFIFVSGLLSQVLRICSDATIQSNATRGAGGREFAIYDISHNAAFLLGIILTLNWTGESGSSPLLLVTSLGFVLGAAVVGFTPRAHDENSTSISTPSATSRSLIRSRAV